MTDDISLTIDDLEVTVPVGTLVVDAAKKIGIEIPVFCYHPKLSSAGMCRMCLVEVGTPVRDKDTGTARQDDKGNPIIRWFPTLQTACTMPVTEGIVVHTRTERVARARKDVLEFLLTSHPLDCPICDKGGECPLQNQTMAYGPGVSRFDYADKQRQQKRVPLGDLIFLDRERCIQCGRCVRFQDEIADDQVLAFANRGRTMEIITFSNPPFNSYFGGNTTDICPVGALTTADFRFGARPWELTRHNSVCIHCSVGCNIVLDTRANGSTGDQTIKRIMPRQNEMVNEIWICDKGRYGHHHARAADRLTTPLITQSGTLVSATWDEALDRITRHIRAMPAAQIAGLAGDRLSNEDLFLFQSLMRDVIGTPHLDAYPYSPGTDMVARYGIGADSDWTDLDKNSLILVVAGDVEEQAPIWFLRIKAAAQRGTKLITVNGRETKLDRYATHKLRIRYGSAPHVLMGLTRSVLTDDPPVGGLEDLGDELSRFDPRTVEGLAGVEAKVLRAAANTFANADNVVVVFGREGLNDNDALVVAQTAANLVLATGHVGRANNGLLPLWPHSNTQGASDMGVRPNAGPGYEQIIEHGWDFAGMRSAVRSGTIRLMWLAGADPVGDDPGVAQTLENLDFLVVQELFLTDTARMADVVLPALSFAERDGTYTSGDRRVQRFERALPPLGSSRADWRIFTNAANRLGAHWSFRSTANILAAINKTVPMYAPLTVEALRATEVQWPPVGQKSFYFSGTAYQNDGGLGLRWPCAAEAKDVRLAFERVEIPSGPKANLGLVGVPVRWLFAQGTLIGRSPVLDNRLLGAVAEFNVKDAERLDVNEGDQIAATIGGLQTELTAAVGRRAPEGAVLVPNSLPPDCFTATVKRTEKMTTICSSSS